MSMGTATVITTAGGTEIVPANGQRVSVGISNASTTVTVYLKLDTSSTVLTTANGFPLAPGASMVFSIDRSHGIEQQVATRQILGITSSTADVRFFEL